MEGGAAKVGRGEGGERGEYKSERRGEEASAPATTTTNRQMKQTEPAEKVKLELTTNGKRLKGRYGSGGKEERKGWEGGGGLGEVQERGRSRGRGRKGGRGREYTRTAKRKKNDEG